MIPKNNKKEIPLDVSGNRCSSQDLEENVSHLATSPKVTPENQCFKKTNVDSASNVNKEEPFVEKSTHAFHKVLPHVVEDDESLKSWEREGEAFVLHSERAPTGAAEEAINVDNIQSQPLVENLPGSGDTMKRPESKSNNKTIQVDNASQNEEDELNKNLDGSLNPAEEEPGEIPKWFLLLNQANSQSFCTPNPNLQINKRPKKNEAGSVDLVKNGKILEKGFYLAPRITKRVATVTKKLFSLEDQPEVQEISQGSENKSDRSLEQMVMEPHSDEPFTDDSSERNNEEEEDSDDKENVPPPSFPHNSGNPIKRRKVKSGRLTNQDSFSTLLVQGKVSQLFGENLEIESPLAIQPRYNGPLVYETPESRKRKLGCFDMEGSKTQTSSSVLRTPQWWKFEPFCSAKKGRLSHVLDSVLTPQKSVKDQK